MAMSARSVCLLVAAVLIVWAALFYVVRASRPSDGGEAGGAIDCGSAMETAKHEAAELGYAVEEMDVHCYPEADHYVVVLSPRANQLGGDVTFKVNAGDGTVYEVIRGQ